MDLSDRFTVPAGVVSKQLAGETVILNLETGIYFGLNVVGTRIWELIDESKSLAEICDSLFEEFEVPRADLERDVLGLAHDLQTRGLILAA